MKVSIKELKDFYDACWEDLLGGSCPLNSHGERGVGWICSECTWLQDDILAQSDNTLVTLDKSGVVYWGGEDETPAAHRSYSPLTVFKRWRAHQSRITIVCTVPKEKETELKDFVKKLGGSC